MKELWLILALLTEIAGIVLVIMSFFNRTDKHPGGPKMNPKYWRPIWMMREWYTPRGYRFHLVGWSIFTVGIVFHLMTYVS